MVQVLSEKIDIQQPSRDVLQHYVGIHPKKYTEQPVGYEMARITNDFKRKGFAQRQSILDIFRASSEGQSILPANYEVETEHDKGKLGTMRFVSSTLILIDVDDDNSITDPHGLLEQLRGECAGYFYTFNHGIKGQRYRLVFQLDRAITDYDIYKAVVVQLAEKISKLIGVTNGQKNPIDTQPKNALLPVRTGKMAPVISDLHATLDATKYIELARREKMRRAEQARDLFENSMKYKVTFSELKDMAEKIGYIPTGTGQGDVWKRLIVGLKDYANSGAITQEEGYELYNLISGGEQPPKNWDNLPASGQATIGSFIKFAQERGYKRKPYRYALAQGTEHVEREHHRVKEYIPSELAKDIIQRRKRILVESSTGSGKSTAFIEASKELSDAKSVKFYIFAAPTRALAEQLGRKHNQMVVKGQTNGLFSAIFSYQKLGNRLFVSTYDMTYALMSWLKKLHPQASFVLIVDEYHKTVTDYSGTYRRDTLDNLQKAGKMASSYIGLSGTPDDILKSEFEQVVAIDNGKPASPSQEFTVYTYQKQKEALPLLVQLIEAWTKQRKLLIYIQSKEVIGKLYDVLRKRGIVTRTVSANEKRNKTYKQLVEDETVEDDVQVILATSVIADGISIKNSLEWECIVVANHFSDLFNPSTLKQMSNRFRNVYRRFSIFMQEPKNTEKDLFNIDAAYGFTYKIASHFSEQLNREFAMRDLSLFRASIIEKKYGLRSDGERISPDKFFLRHEASNAQESYYKGRRKAFIVALEKALHKKCAGNLNISSAVVQNGFDIATIEADISELDEQIRLDNEARKQGFSENFTKEVYQAFQVGNEALLRRFKEHVTANQFACVKGLAPFATYEVCKQIADALKRDCDTYSYLNRVKRMVDIWYYSSISRNTQTKRVYQALSRIEGAIASSEMQDEIKKIARKNKVSPKDVGAVLNQCFNVQRFRNKVQWFTELSPLTIDTIASEHGLSRQDVLESIEMYSQKQSKTIQVVVAENIRRSEKQQMQLKLG